MVLNKKKLWTFIISFSILLFLFFLLVVFLILSLKFLNLSIVQDFTIGNTRDYKYLQVSQNRSTHGMVTLSRDLRFDEFISYDNNEGKVLISNFGTDEYVCLGSCFCEGNERRATAAVSRGLIFLLSAVSSIMALQKAKDHFENECVSKNHEICEGSSVSASVESCEAYSNEADNEFENEKGSVDKDPQDQRVYFCKGICSMNRQLNKEATKKALDFTCEKMYSVGEIDVDTSEIPSDDLFLSTYTTKNSQLLEAVQRKFVREQLEEYCFRNSQEYKEKYATTNEEKKEMEVKKNLCIGKYVKYTEDGNKRGTVLCRQIEPSPDPNDEFHQKYIRYWLEDRPIIVDS